MAEAPKAQVALFTAIREKQKDVFMKMLQDGTDISVENEEGNALTIAAEVGDCEMIQLLLKNGFDVNTRNIHDNMTPLMKAACNNRLLACLELIVAGADTNLKEKFGFTALAVANVKKNKAVITLLSDEKRMQELASNGRKKYITIVDLIAKQQQHTIVIEKRLSSQRIEIPNLTSMLPTTENELKKAIAQLRRRDEEILDLKHEIRKNNLNTSDFNWLIQKGKDVHDETFKIRQAANIYAIPAYENKFIENVKKSKNTLSSFLLLFNQCIPKKITLNLLLDEMSELIQKNSVQIETYHEDRQSQLKINLEKYKIAESNLNIHMKKMDILFDELIKLEKLTISLETSKAHAKRDMDKNQEEVNESIIFLSQTKQIVTQIKAIEKENKEFFEKWNKKIAQEHFSSWQNDKTFLRFILEIVDLDDWFDDIETQLLTDVNIFDLRPIQLMAVKKKLPGNQDFISISWIQAKYLCSVIEEIKTNKKIPTQVNDIDLNTSNIKMWTNKNIVTYFKNLGMTEVTSIFSKLYLNGLVFFYLNEYEVQELGIKNLQELNLLLSQLKTIQNQVLKAIETKLVTKTPPSSIICPLSHQVMVDPVIAQDGYTYERKAIEEWFKTNNTSPTSHEEIEKFLIPSKMARALCDKWRIENSQ